MVFNTRPVAILLVLGVTASGCTEQDLPTEDLRVRENVSGDSLDSPLFSNVGSLPSIPLQSTAATSSNGIVLQDVSDVVIDAIFTETASQNVLSIVSPISQELASGNPITGSWRFGPFDAGSVVAFQLFSGIKGGPSLQRVSGQPSCWTVFFEDFTDNDFNDLVLSVQAIPVGGEFENTGPGASAKIQPSIIPIQLREDGEKVTAAPASFVIEFSAVTACAEEPVEATLAIHAARSEFRIGSELTSSMVTGRGEFEFEIPVGTPLTTDNLICFFAKYEAPSGQGTPFQTILRVCAQAGVGLEVEITEIETQNAGSSFTAPNEASVEVEAEVTPEDFAGEVEWRVEDNPEDEVETRVPEEVVPGLMTSFEIPAPDPGRWNTLTTHPGNLNQKSLSLKITAIAEEGDERAESEPKTITQDETDTARQEYIDLTLPTVPGRGEFQAETRVDRGRNTGDYGIAILDDGFLQSLDELEDEWDGNWQINSIYRNPVHQQIHVGSVATSLHQYGCAADLQVFPVRGFDDEDNRVFDSEADSLDAENFWSDLADLAEANGMDVEPRADSGIGHVHVESC